MNEDNRKRVYDVLKEQTGYLDSYEDFNKAFDASEDNRKRVYDVLKNQTGYLDSYEDFTKGMSAPVTSVAQQVIDEYDQANQSSMNTGAVINDNSASPQLQQNQSPEEDKRTLFSNYVQEQLGNINKELNKPREALPMPAGSAFIPSTAVAAAQRYGNTQTREQQDRYTSLVAARNFLDDANKIVTEAGKKGNTNFVAGALRGARDKGFDPDTWMMGISEASYYDLLRRAAEKEERGEQLSPEETQLLDAAAVNMAANAYYAQDLGRGYKAGAVTAESIPFMLQFALNPVSGAGKGIAKTILQHGIKRFGLNTAKRTAAGRALRGAARVAGDAIAAASLTATTSLGNVVEDAERRMTGDVKFAEDDKGNIQYAGRENNVGTGEAIARAFTSTFFENQSEMVGNYFAPIMRGVSGLLKRLPGVKQLSASKMGEIYRGIKSNPTYKEFTDRTQWHGAIGEYAEEVYNNLASVAMGDMTPEELVDLNNNIDTFLGVGLMSAVFGGIGAAGFARDRYMLNRDVKRFESTLSPDEIERWNEVKRVAQSGDVEGVREFVKYTMRDSSLTPQEKKDKIKYIYDVMRQSAMENVAAEQTEETVQAETEDIVANSDPQTNTYTECNRLVMNDVGETVEVPGHIVGYMGGQPLWKPDGAGPEVEAVVLKEGEYNPESIQSMPTQEVIDETAAAIREDAAAQAQRESTYSPDIVPYNQLEPGRSSFYDKDGNLYSVGNVDTDTKNFMMLVTSPEGKQIASRPFSEEEYLSIRQAQIDAEEQTQQTSQSQDASSGGKENSQPEQTITPQQQEVDALRQAGVDEEVIRNTIADRVKKAKTALDKAERQLKAPIKDAKTVKEEIAARKKALDEARAAYEGWNTLLNPESAPQTKQAQVDARAGSIPQGRSLTSNEADALLADMESRAEVAPELELTIENWDAQFGADALVKTPIGEVKMGENQFAKMMRQGRNGKLGMVKPTLENPDAIIEDNGGNVDENAVERASSYIFVKAFAKPDGVRYYYFTSVTVSKDGREVVISNQEKSQKRISKLLRQNPVAWINDKFSSHPITQIEGSVPLSETNKPTQTDNRPALLGVNSPKLSEDKGTNHSAKKQASAMETISTDEKGRPLYHRASVDAALANINSKGLTSDEVDAFVRVNKDAAFKLLKKEEDKAPKMVTDLDKYVADKAAWQARVADAQSQVDYWNQVEDAIRQQRMQVGDTTAEDILAMGEPMDGLELAAQMLATGKLPLLQSDFKRETGYKGDESRSLFGLFASEANGGMTIERAGEQLMLADQEAGTHFFDQSDPNAGRNAILDVLSEVRTRGDLTNYIRRNREAMAERERQDEYDAYSDWCEREMHMTPEEYEAYQGYVATNNPYEGVAVEELDRIFAEAEEEIQTYSNQQDNGQGTSENGSIPDSGSSERDEPAGETENGQGGLSVLPEAQAVLSGQIQGRADGTETEPGTADDGVRVEEGTVSEGASGGERITGERTEGGASGVEARPAVSQETDENGYPFVLASDGTSTFGNITEETGLPIAPIKLSSGFQSEDGKGYGLAHIEYRHGEQIRNAGFPSIEAFVEDVAKNFTVIKRGNARGENKTYLLEVQDAHNNTLFIELSKDGSYWNVNSAGIFKKGYSKKKDIVWTLPALGSSTNADATEVNHGQTEGETVTSGDSSQTISSENKGSESTQNDQTNNEFIAPERQEDESLLDYAERVVKTKEIDDARKEVSSNPTDAQKEAGNYKKGHITLDGYDITIENPKGSTRSGVDASGQPWSVTMNNDYGYIRGTEGVDGDHIDVFLSDDPTTGDVFVIDQVNEDGTFDEHKVMYGFKSALAAKRAYLANYSPGWKGLGNITKVSKEEFKKWVDSSHRKTKPFAEYKSVKVEGAQSEAIKTHQPHALPGRLMKAYESGNASLITSMEQEMREFVNGATDMRSVYATYLRSKDLERAVEKGSPSNKTQHFIAETCKDALKKAGLPAKAMQSERARTEVAGSTTDPHMLDVMSADTSFNVLRAIIHNPNTYEATLKYFTEAFSNNGLDYEAQQELEKRQSENGDELRFREVDAEDKKELVAVHNLSADKLKQAFDLGGFPMPSIAITKADVGHTEFGEISLVFDKESINPTDGRNKVYGEDAWTPTFPTVGYKLNDDKTSDIYRRANKAGSLPLFNPVIFHPDNYENYISSVGPESLVNHFKDDYGAKQLYLSENGNAVEKYEQHEVDKYLPDQIALYEKMLKEIGIERLKNERSDALENDVKRLIEEHYDIDLDTMKPFRAKVRISNTIHHAVDYAEQGNRKIETDIEATKKKIDERIDPEKFEAWLENLFSGVVEKNGIRNDKDMFTPSGSSRKWEQLYDDITLDSVVKAMQRQAARDGQGLFNGSIFGAAQKEYKSIDEIRKEARERIRTMDDSEYKAQRDAITDRLSNIKISGVGNGFSDTMDMAGNIQDAVSRSHTAKGIHKYLKGFYPKVTMETANEIVDIVKDIQRMSARYFEAKPYRAVGFDEVRLAVVPSDMDKKLVRELEQRGIPVRIYEKGNESQRRQIVEEATEDMNLRFRKTREENESFNGNYSDDALSSANDPVAKMMGKSTRTVRQRQVFAERERRNMAKRVQELSEKLHLDNVEIVTEPMTITDRQGKTHHPKGFYNPRTGKIVIVVPNNMNTFDIEQTLLHEAVAHYGLRKLFGEHFDTFLDNVFNNADVDVRRKIVELAKKNGWNPRLATEEYLASLAENTNFEDLNASWWQKIKELFLQMLHKIGFNDFNGVTLSDNELRYILWRSYENLAEPGRYRSILGEAADVVKQNELKVGNYASVNGNVNQVADARESVKAERIRKLRDSKPVEITGEEYQGKYELNRDSAQKYLLDHLRGEYTIKDTGEKVEFSKVGAKKVTSHSMGNEAHLKSIAAIPQIIHNAIFIEERPPYKKDAKYDSYRYYVTGLKIGGKDYTVRMTIGVKNGEYYYDHYLTDIEKGNLIEIAKGFTPTEDAPNPSYAEDKDSVSSSNTQKNKKEIEKGKLLDLINGQTAYDNGFGTTPGTKPTTEIFSNYRDKILLSILQTNDEENLLFRETPDGETTDDGSRDAYNRAVTGNRFKAQEAYQDSMLALKRLQEVVEKFSGQKLKSYENAYMAENQMSSKSTRETEVYGERFFKPMLQEVANIIKKGASYQEIIDYMVAKHGLERNEVFAERDASHEAERRFEKFYKELEQLYKLGGITQDDYEKRRNKIDTEKEEYYQKRLAQHLEEDYSGLTALAEKYDEADKGFKANAEDLVNNFEARFDTRSLWEKVNAATKETLRKSYESGMMSKDTYDKINKMFSNYIPLRGWDVETAEDVFEYLNSETSPVNSVLKSAKGRRSMSDDPLATIGNMAESTILQGNRNLMKQNFLNMAINHPTDVLTFREAWYVKDPSTGEWVLSFPNIEENDDSDTIARKVEEHEERMNMLKEKGEATQVKEGLNIDYRISARQAKEHIVNVKRNGKDYLIFVNGSPRAAQAVNGQTNPNVENGWMAGVSRFNRWMAANFTTRNPAFVISNLSRDLIFSISAVRVKEGSEYARQFSKNIPSSMRAIARGLRGKQSQTEADRYFQEFLDNGGETGFTALHNVDEYKRIVRKELKKLRNETDYLAAMKWVAGKFSTMNRWAEDVARFNAYMTSRQQGKTITESINDAKEVTVNFNRKGAGFKTKGFFGKTSGVFRGLYLFFNAAVQSLANFIKLGKKNPKTFFTLLGGFTSAGFLVPMINALLIGDGDDDYYGNLPDWVRRNNICIYVGDGKFFTLPLPIELRAFYGLGEIAYQATVGKDEYASENVAYAAINQITELLPLNPLGNNGDIVTTFMPNFFSPFWEAGTNEDFTGKPIFKRTPFNESMPEWTKAYKGTSSFLVDASKKLNEWTGGDKYRKGWIDKIHIRGFYLNNPAQIEHLFESYFGGMAKTFNQTAKTLAGGVESVLQGEKSDDLQWYSTPVLNRFINDASDDRSSFSKVNERYYKLYELYEEVGKELRGYGREAARGNWDYLDKLNRLYQSDDFKKYSIFKRNKRIIDRIRDMEKRLPEEATKEKEELQKKVSEMKRSLLEQIDNLK